MQATQVLVLLVAATAVMTITCSRAESILSHPTTPTGDGNTETRLRAVGRSLVVEVKPRDTHATFAEYFAESVVTNIRKYDSSGLYVGDTSHGPATADIVSDSCVVIYGRHQWRSICNSQVSVTPSLAHLPNRGHLYSTVDPATPLPPTSCAFHVMYTRRFLSVLGSESNVARYITTVFKLADLFYQESLPGSNSSYGIHLSIIDHTSQDLPWSDSSNINDQLDAVNANSPNGSCGTALFDAADYAQLRAGVATLNGACVNGSNGVVVSCGAQCANTFFAAQVLAHEAGHLFGAQHVSIDSCGNDIMSPVVTSNLRYFSGCTTPTLEDFFYEFMWCLTPFTRPKRSSSTDRMLLFGLLGGGIFVALLLAIYAMYAYRSGINTKTSNTVFPVSKA